MIDFIKINISYIELRKLLENSNINWTRSFDNATGEVYEYPIIGTHHNLRLKINPTRKELSGSIHKLNNNLRDNENHNYDDFDYKDLVNMIFYLKNETGIDPKRSILENLEYGVNVLIGKSPESLLKENVIVWNGICNSMNDEFNGKGKYYQWKQSQYYIKTYDKGKQYQRDSHIWRWEKKVIKNEYLFKNFKIKYLSDLLDKEKLIALQNDLLASFEKLIIVDSLTPNVTFTEKEQLIWNKGINPKTWENLKSKHRSQKSRLINKFSQLIHRKGLDNKKYDLKERLNNKWNDLLECNELTDIIKPENATILPVYIVSNSCNTNIDLFGPVPEYKMTYKKYKKRSPEEIPFSDIYEVKKERNDKSNPSHNYIRSLSKIISHLKKYDSDYLIRTLQLTEQQKEKIISLNHIPRWSNTIDTISKYHDLS